MVTSDFPQIMPIRSTYARIIDTKIFSLGKYGANFNPT